MNSYHTQKQTLMNLAEHLLRKIQVSFLHFTWCRKELFHNWWELTLKVSSISLIIQIRTFYHGQAEVR